MISHVVPRQTISQAAAGPRFAGDDLLLMSKAWDKSGARARGDGMAFISKFTFKVDRKGRVSVPAEFRPALTKPDFSGVIAFPSPHNDAIRCMAVDQMEKIVGARDPMEVFNGGPADVALAAAADMVRLPFDGEGRVLLPKHLTDFARITDSATFVGRMTYFEIWNPDAFAAHHAPLRAAQRGAIAEGGNGRS